MAMGSHLRAIKQGSKMIRFAFFNGRNNYYVNCWLPNSYWGELLMKKCMITNHLE